MVKVRIKEMIIDTDWDEIGERPNLNRKLWDNFVDKDTFYLKIFHDMIGEDKKVFGIQKMIITLTINHTNCGLKNL